MNMDTWSSLLYRCQNIQISLASVVWMNSTLHTNFASATIPCFSTSASNFLGANVVRSASQVFTVLTLRKCAELAFEVAYVGVVDVSIDHVTNCVTIDLFTKRVCTVGNEREIVAAALK